MNLKEHLLTLLIEECAEVQQCATKALRFGLDDVKPGASLDNMDRLKEEIVDLKAIVHLLQL